MTGLSHVQGLVGVNSNCGVQSKRRCESHESCICIAGLTFNISTNGLNWVALLLWLLLTYPGRVAHSFCKGLIKLIETFLC